VEPGLIVDFTADGQAIGIEITAPAKLSLAALNKVLKELGHAPANKADLAPDACGLNAQRSAYQEIGHLGGQTEALKNPTAGR
jgi:hypothetical protein